MIINERVIDPDLKNDCLISVLFSHKIAMNKSELYNTGHSVHNSACCKYDAIPSASGLREKGKLFFKVCNGVSAQRQENKLKKEQPISSLGVSS